MRVTAREGVSVELVNPSRRGGVAKPGLVTP